MTEAGENKNPVHEFMVNAVQTAWSDTPDGVRRAMLLSTLGTKLKNEFGDYRAHFPKGIKEFLRTWPLVQMVQHPQIREKIALVPAGEQLPDDVTRLFENVGERRGSSEAVSYDQRFWNAFYKPIRSSRHVAFGADGKVQILEDANALPEVAYEITKDDILSPEQTLSVPEKVEATRDRISNWLQKNSLDRSRFLRMPADRTENHRDRLVSLKHAFERISDADRSRISIPLDILLKILS